MNMTVNPLMSAFLAICTEMNVTNRKVSIIGNSSWTPNVSGQLMKDVVSKWKNCELLGIRFISSPPCLMMMQILKNWQISLQKTYLRKNNRKEG